MVPQHLGVRHVVWGMWVLWRVAQEVTGGHGVDVAIEALGNAATFETAVEMAADGGKAVMVGIAPLGQKAGVEMTRIVRRNVSETHVLNSCLQPTERRHTRVSCVSTGCSCSNNNPSSSPSAGKVHCLAERTRLGT